MCCPVWPRIFALRLGQFLTAAATAPAIPQVAEEKATAAASTLKRYLHYYQRFAAHAASRKLESKLLASVSAKVKAVEAGKTELQVRSSLRRTSITVLNDCPRRALRCLACISDAAVPDTDTPHPPRTPRARLSDVSA